MLGFPMLYSEPQIRTAIHNWVVSGDAEGAINEFNRCGLTPDNSLKMFAARFTEHLLGQLHVLPVESPASIAD